MKLLAIDTATEACSAALWLNGEIRERFEICQNGHSKLILPMIDGLLAEADLQPSSLDGLAFGCGPGSFTGVRIATGVTQGIAFGLDLPVMPVSNLAAVAQDFFDSNPEDVAFVAMDARMDEVYWGVYQRDLSGFSELLGEEAVTPPNRVDFPELFGVGIGSGWKAHHQALITRLGDYVQQLEVNALPRARAVARLGAEGFRLGMAVGAEQAVPVYLRDRVAKKTTEQ